MAKKNKTRRVIIGFITVLAVLAVLVGVLPMLLNAGLGRGFIERRFSATLNGAATIGDMDLKWSGSQKLTDVVIHDADGQQVADLDTQLDATLFALIFGLVDEYEANVSGTVHGVVHEDGSFSLADLIKTDQTKSGAATPSSTQRPNQPIVSLQGVSPFHVRINSLDVQLNDVAGERTIVIDDLKGTARYAPGGELAVQLDAATQSNGTTGAMTANLVAESLFDARGVMQPRGATLKFDLNGESLPVAGSPNDRFIDNLTLQVTSHDLLNTIAFSMESKAGLDAQFEQTFEARGALDEPLTENGSMNFSLRRLTASVAAKNFPTTIVQPLFAHTPVRLTRDLGPTAAIEAAIDHEEGSKAVVSLRSDHIETFAQATVHEQSDRIVLETARLSGMVHADLIHAYVPDMTLEKPLHVNVDVTELNYPMPRNGQAFDVAQIAGAGSIELTETTSITITGSHNPKSFEITEFQCNFESPGLGDRLVWNGSAAIDHSHIEFDETITNFLQPGRAFDPWLIQAEGRLAIENIDRATLEKAIGRTITFFDEIAGESANITIFTERANERLNATVIADAANIRADLRANKRDNTIDVTNGRVNLTVTPDLFSTIQQFMNDGQMNEDPALTLARPASMEATLQPFSIAFRNQPNEMLAGQSIRLHGNADSIVFASATEKDTPSSEHQKSITFGTAIMSAALNVKGKEHEKTNVELTGRTSMQVTGASRLLGELHGGISIPDVYDPRSLTGEVMARGLNTAQIETALGLPAGRLNRWLGDVGDVTLSIPSKDESDVEIKTNAASKTITAHVDVRFPTLEGKMLVTPEGDVVSLRNVDLNYTLTQAALNDVFDQPGQQRFDAQNDLSFGITSALSMLPVGMLTGQEIKSETLSLDVRAESLTPWTLQYGPGKAMTYHNIRVVTAGDDLSDGIDVNVYARGVTGSGGAPSDNGAQTTDNIRIESRISELLDASNQLNISDAHLDGDVFVAHMPTAIVDGAMGLNHYLVDAVGPMMRAEIRATNMSRESGRLKIDIQSERGTLTGDAIVRRQALRIDGKSPVTAELELADALRQRILARVHPIFRDIRTTEKPVRMELANARLPMDGDVSQLNADVNITIGQVDFEAGSALFLAMLASEHAANVEIIPGSIDPIAVRIRNGVVTYDRFHIKVGDVSFGFNGRIDLNTREVALRWSVPAGRLSNQFGRVRELQDERIPLLTHGTFGDLKTEIDPEFDVIGALIRAGLRREGLFDDLGDLFNGNKDETDKPNLEDLFDFLPKKKSDSDSDNKEDKNE